MTWHFKVQIIYSVSFGCVRVFIKKFPWIFTKFYLKIIENTKFLQVFLQCHRITPNIQVFKISFKISMKSRQNITKVSPKSPILTQTSLQNVSICHFSLFILGKCLDMTWHFSLFISGKCHWECLDIYVKGNLAQLEKALGEAVIMLRC